MCRDCCRACIALLPTHVGVNRHLLWWWWPHRSAPHARGGEPLLQDYGEGIYKCSPRMWG